jgi:hypothetical protein
MKTTIDLPDLMFRKAKSTAAERGISLKAFIAEAVERILTHPAPQAGGKPWIRAIEGVPKIQKSVAAGIAQRVAESDAADRAKQLY